MFPTHNLAKFWIYNQSRSFMSLFMRSILLQSTTFQEYFLNLMLLNFPQRFFDCIIHIGRFTRGAFDMIAHSTAMISVIIAYYVIKNIQLVKCIHIREAMRSINRAGNIYIHKGNSLPNDIYFPNDYMHLQKN